MPLIIYVVCPKTGKSVSTGMATDKKSFEESSDNQWDGNSFTCPACGATHGWSKKDAVLKDLRN